MYRKHYFVYIRTSKPTGTLYIGVTNNLLIRSFEHIHKFIDGFTKKYNVHMLVYYEMFTDVLEAIKREKQLKWWKRDWKIKLIKEHNPEWNDLYESYFKHGSQPSLG